MDALILAAGRGTRMGEIDKPKCLLDLGGISIIKYQIKCLKNIGINKIFIVTGYNSEQIHSHLNDDFNFLHNVDFATTNNLYSVWTARNSLNDDFICIYGDLLFDQRILDYCINDVNDICLVVEKNVREETMKVKIENNTIIKLNKNIPENDADGNFIGMAKFRKSIIPLFFNKISKLVENNNFNSYYTEAIELMIKDNIKINYIETNNFSWMDIDEQNEFQVAKKLFYKMSENSS
jgi:choline kinase